MGIVMHQEQHHDAVGIEGLTRNTIASQRIVQTAWRGGPLGQMLHSMLQSSV